MNTVTFKEGTDVDLLEAALKELGYFTNRVRDTLYFSHRTMAGSGSFQAGTFTVPQGTDVTTMKREYSRQSVLATAKKFNWKVEQDKKDRYKMQIRKRV
jgi:hypothetical protein